MDKIFNRITAEKSKDNYIEHLKSYRPADYVSNVANYLGSEAFNTTVKLIEAGAYVPRPKAIKTVLKGNGESRIVYSYSFEDKVILGLMNYALRQYRDSFIRFAYAATGKKGRNGFIECIQQHLAGKYYVLTDIHHFSDSILKDRMADKLDKFFQEDVDFCTFLKSMLKDDKYPEPAIKSGNPLCSVFTNIYLNDIDQLMASEPDITYIRYIDSVVILADSRELIEEKLALYYKLLKEEGLEPNYSKEVLGAPGDKLAWGLFCLQYKEQERVDIAFDQKILNLRLNKFYKRVRGNKPGNILEAIKQTRQFIAQINLYNQRMYNFNIYRYNKQLLAQIQAVEIDAIRCFMFGGKGNGRYKVKFKQILKLGYKSLL